MAKKAFCVRINGSPYDGSDLNGCVNNARAWAELRRRAFDAKRRHG
jgi:metacaspase-1